MDWASLNWVDWVFIAVLLYGAGMGVFRGLSHELAALISIVVAVFVTRLFYLPIADTLCGWWGWNPEITRLLAVVFLMLLSLLGMRLLRIALGAMMTFAFKGMVERLGGLVTGMVRQGAVFLIILLAAYFVPSPWLQRSVSESRTGEWVLPHLVDGYNKMAEKAALISADVPVGVELPQYVMPPPIDSASEEGYVYPPLENQE